MVEDFKREYTSSSMIKGYITNEKAIDTLQRFVLTDCNAFDRDFVDALKLALNSLKKETYHKKGKNMKAVS